MSEQGIRVLNHSLSCVVGDLSRGNLYRSSQEESAGVGVVQGLRRGAYPEMRRDATQIGSRFW